MLAIFESVIFIEDLTNTADQKRTLRYLFAVHFPTRFHRNGTAHLPFPSLSIRTSIGTVRHGVHADSLGDPVVAVEHQSRDSNQVLGGHRDLQEWHYRVPGLTDLTKGMRWLYTAGVVISVGSETL